MKNKYLIPKSKKAKPPAFWMTAQALHADRNLICRFNMNDHNAKPSVNLLDVCHHTSETYLQIKLIKLHVV